MKRIVLVLLVVFSGIFLLACGSEQVDVVGEVNGEKISQADFEKNYNILKNRYELEMAGSYGESDEEEAGAAHFALDEEKDKEIIEQLKEQAFEGMVLQKLVLQEASRQGIDVSDEEIDAEIEYFKEITGQENADGFKNFLKENNLNEKDLREGIRSQKLSLKLQEKIGTEIEVSDEELQQFYDDNSKKFQESGSIQVYHILVETEEKARDILEKLKEGQDFSELAREYSSCPSKEKGGYLQIVNDETDNLDSDFKEAALKLKAGDITQDPVKTRFGYHIIKAEKAEIAPFDEIKNKLMLDLKAQKETQAYYDYIKELRDKADIKNYLFE